MRGIQFIIAFCGLLVVSATHPQAASPTEYRCGSTTAKGALRLPVPSSDGEVVFVTVHGRRLAAAYESSGLDQLWFFEESLYIVLRPDGERLEAFYMDFRGAKPGETRKPKSIFYCQ